MTAVTKLNAVQPLPMVESSMRRFLLPDLNDKGIWLIGRLQVRYPHLQDRQLIGWFRGLIDSNESLFIRTDHAVALAQIVHESLSPQPDVVERFVLCEESKSPDKDDRERETGRNIAEAMSLYNDIMRWSETLGARRVSVNRFTDVPRDMLKEHLGRMFMEEHWYIKVSK